MRGGLFPSLIGGNVKVRGLWIPARALPLAHKVELGRHSVCVCGNRGTVVWFPPVNPPRGPSGTISGDIRASVAPAAAQPPIASFHTQPAPSEGEKKKRRGGVSIATSRCC